ncbi:aminoglycoside 3'-phosphotransferase [Humibacter sp.]|uniref:aminoglycoside 3'-phosphotransferase n=1 Tax=Humibacter sp. TaxID=1940291 RepID=UPI002CDE541E|nr:aminoglycoside 3'-phosphotransferase [Humibacter sp.]HVX06614.1 aminoglycoside 3'-phosphotransferase [Humibacter sp.]
MTVSGSSGIGAPDTGSPAGTHGVRVFSGRPEASFAVPEPLRRRLGDGIESVVWVNEIGGVTVSGSLGREPVFAKWAPPGSELDLAAEVERLAWAGRYIRVPEVVEYSSGEDGDVLVTRAIAGANAVTQRWLAEPRQAVIALGEGLRSLHESLPVASCPFEWTVKARVARSRAEGIRERIDLLDRLPPAPSVDSLVVCHGDACAPNTLLTDEGTVAGYVDVGRLGIGDRWGDIAVGAWSTEWNYGEGYTGLYYEAYGVEPDEEHIRFYRSLWDAT